MTNKDYALLAGKFLSDKKAKDIVIIDIQVKPHLPIISCCVPAHLKDR